MAGVFLSYSRADRALAEKVMRHLRRLGVDAWWDEHMPSVDWQDELGRQIHQMAGVVVLWTPSSVASKNVKDEARLGLNTDKLVNALHGVAAPPFPFDRVNGLPLDDWDGVDPHGGWTRLVQSIEALVIKAGAAKPGDIVGALDRREAEVRRRRQVVGRAQAAFQQAQVREGEAGEADETASTAYDRAAQQLESILAMRPGPLILAGAQQEFEAAREAKAAAEAAQRAAKAGLSESARALSLAKEDFERLLSDDEEPARAAAAPDPPAEPVRAEALPTHESPRPPASPPIVVPPSAQPRSPPPQPAPRKMQAFRPAPVKPLWIVAAGVASVVVIAGLIALHGAGASSASVASAGPAAAQPDPMAQATAAAAPLAGSWAPAGLSCDSPVTITVSDQRLSLTASGTTTSADIEPESRPDAVTVHAADGEYRYALGANNALTVTGPSGPPMTMTRCAG